MISRVYSLELNMSAAGTTEIPTMQYVQGDTGVNGMNIRLVYEEEAEPGVFITTPVDLTGCLVTVISQRCDGHLSEKMLIKDDTVNGEVVWEMEKADVSVPGEVTVTVQVYDGYDGRMTSEEFEYEVIAALTEDEELYSSTQYDLYVNARHCGSYSNATRYFMNNIVEYAGASYMALRDTQGQPPPPSPDLSNAYWHLLSQRGSTGWKGTYEPGAAYGVGDMVEHLGSSWICVRECTGQSPPDTPTGSSEYWDLLARIGAVSSVNGQAPDAEGALIVSHNILADIPLAGFGMVGHVKVGNGLDVDPDGDISVESSKFSWIYGW